MWLSDFLVWVARLFARKPAPSSGPVQTASPPSPVPQNPTPATEPPAAVPDEPTRHPEPAANMTPAEFIAAIKGASQVCARRTGVRASVTIAQAALESAWGSRAPGFNLFGIKADASWSGAVTQQVTHEVVGGRSVVITARFRAYPDWQGSIDDHAAFLRHNPRYAPAFASKDGLEFADAIARCGYATDPDYARKLKSIITVHGLMALD